MTEPDEKNKVIKTKYTTHAIVKQLKEVGENADITILTGFWGEATEEKTQTFYFDPLLHSFINIKEDDVIHHISLKGGQFPIGGSMIWLNNASQYFTHKPCIDQGSQDNYAAYFQGNIVNQCNVNDPNGPKKQF